ncbi:MAG: phosphatase PAP2 family protein, partial [Chitinophagaceae bacterium]
MKQTMLSTVLILSVMAGLAQTAGTKQKADAKQAHGFRQNANYKLAPTAGESSNYEAATWQLWYLDNPGELSIAPPPGVAQTKIELETVKQRMKSVDHAKLQTIRYWDSGAPSYRWNQVATEVIPWENPDVILRMPLAWVNLAVYDATVLAWSEKLKYKRMRPAVSDPALQIIIKSPSNYSYPCEHSVTAAAAAYVLAYFIPAKGDSIIEVARTASQTRIDAGAQFPSDVEAGWKLGQQVALQIIEKAKNDGSAKAYNGPVN